jgi:hypothetical protein
MDTLELKTIELQEEIYEIRKTSGIQRQEIHSTDFYILDKHLKDLLQQTHPYSLAFSQKQLLEAQVPNYQKCGNGLQAQITCEGYLYRIANPIDVFANIKTENFKKEDIYISAMELWNKLNTLSELGTKWLPLSEHGEKPYWTNGQISWWTRHDLDNTDTSIIENATRLGLFENWVANEIYLLRCKADICTDSPIASVPTIIDAYASVAFYTTENVKNPVEGTTINLSLTPLNLGISEFVLKKIDLNSIEIKPVSIKSEERRMHSHIVSKDVKMLESLKAYYQNMI